MKIENGEKRGRGRPRGFDQQAALERAMELFWERGFEGTSMSDLTEAMRISPSSLYATFGDKERLYQAAVHHYQAGPGSYVARVLDSLPQARQAIERLLEVAARELTRCSRPTGCMVALAANQCSPETEAVQKSMHQCRVVSLELITKRLQRGLEAGELPQSVDTTELADFYTAILHGMSIQARDGASEGTLLGIGKLAMRCWPQ